MGERSLNRKADFGYSLLEVLVSLVFLTVAALSVMQSLAVAATAYSLSQRQWLAAVERWNRVVELRADPPTEAEGLMLAPGIPPLRRFPVPGEGPADDWEVLIARR
jgi:hypothetical protein